jgi:hypothetical protein
MDVGGQWARTSISAPVLPRLIGCALRQAKSLQGASHVGVGIVDGNRAAHFDFDDLFIDHEIPVEGPAIPAGKVNNAAVRLQVRNRGRCTELFQIRRRRAGDKAHIADPAANERGILQVPHPHRTVNAFLRHVDQAIGEADRQLNLRIKRVELGYVGQHQVAPYRPRQIDPELAFGLFGIRAAESKFGCVDRIQYVEAALEVFGAVCGQ